MAAQGRDIKLSPARVEGYRNFATKLWNAARFAEINACAARQSFDPASATQTINRWIAGESERALAAVTEALEAYRFNEAAGAIYSFIWHKFCDWYLELIKPILSGADQEAAAETRAMTAWVLDRALKLLHPFMPFVTEELWAKLAARRRGEGEPPHPRALAETSGARERGRRRRDRLGDQAHLRGALGALGDECPCRREGAARHLRRKRRDDGAGEAPRGDHPPSCPHRGHELRQGACWRCADRARRGDARLPLAGIIDVAAESKRLKREIDKVGSEIRQLDAKLANEKFVARAPEHVVEEQRERKADAEATAARLEQALKRLEAAL